MARARHLAFYLGNVRIMCLADWGSMIYMETTRVSYAAARECSSDGSWATISLFSLLNDLCLFHNLAGLPTSTHQSA